jgi:S1-C subfamily serine protease
MPNPAAWAFPERLQPKQADLRFNLQGALDAAVLIRAEIPEDAFTASILGTERVGNGIVIREDGLVLTIGYLITEATSIWLTSNDGKVVPAHPLAYDQVTGFGLVLPLGPFGAPLVRRGSIANAEPGDEVVVVGHGGRAHSLRGQIVAKHEFAGYWEYVLDEALFVAPPHPQWGGSALLDEDGLLLGIGSLLVQDRESLGGEAQQGNMFVPVDLLAPILDDMLKLGRSAAPPRPWLGMYTADEKGQLEVVGLATGGPADRAGVRLGDLVLEVAGGRVAGLADLWRKIWAVGPVGTEVPLALARSGAVKQVRVRSADRNDFLKKPRVH